MSVEYTIAAIPTLYRGRMYRSRLEARWAAFFDRLGWTHEYEPFDLGVWSPDFAITQPFNGLIEVKPITEFNQDTAEKMYAATKDKCIGFHLLTMVAPKRIDWESEGDIYSAVQIGWLAVSTRRALLTWQRETDRPKMHAHVISWVSDGSLWLISDGDSGSTARGDPEPEGLWYANYTLQLWADACNAVQWEPRQ